MSYSISGNTISLTRGDTLSLLLDVRNSSGTEYEPAEGDMIVFTMKKSCSDATALITKEIDTDDLTLVLDPEDTEGLAFGKYVYDIQITLANGDVDTIIPNGTFKLTEEVG